MKFNRIVSLFTLIAFTFVTLFSPFPGPSSTAQAQNTGSLRLITDSANFSFKKDLQLGDTDPDVKELQKMLNLSPDTLISSSGAGSPGLESSYFGVLTKNAVIKFQEKYRSEILTPNGLTAGNGLVSRATRTKLNLLLGITTPTLASVGFPQSRAGTGVNTVTAPTTSSSGMSICQFVELLITIQAIIPSKADSARTAMKCPLPAPIVVTPPPQTGMSVCAFVDLLINIGVIDPSKADAAKRSMNCTVIEPGTPTLTLKVNGSRGPITVLPGTELKIRWTATNVTSCSDGKNSIPKNGLAKLTANKSMSYPVSCIGNNGKSIVESVTVVVSSQQTATSSDIQLSNAKVIPGYNFATFEAVTSIRTKMVIAYTSDPVATSSVKVYESPSYITNHSHKITGLLPSTLYYAVIAFVAEDADSFTLETTFTTLANNSGSNNNPDVISQKVLLSASGGGVVAVPGSQSLKNDKKVTLEAWVKPTSWSTNIGLSNTSDSVVISKGNIGNNLDYVLSLDNGKLVYSNNDASLWTCAPTVPLNIWTHVAVAVDENISNISLFVNGVKQNSICEGARGIFNKASRINKANAITEKVVSSTGAYDWSLTTPVTSNVYFGNFYPTSNMCSTSSSNTTYTGGWGSNDATVSSPSSWGDSTATLTEGNGFIGLIDNIKIWNVARTEAQIKTGLATSTTATAGSYEPNLVGHWSFDDGQAADQTYNMNRGALKGDMRVVDDDTAPSKVVGSEFNLGGLDFNFPEVCDDGLLGEEEEEVVMPDIGYKVTFKGGTKSVTPAGPNSVVLLETCDDPKEDLVKSVELIGDAPPRDPSYYNNMGNISVIIAPGLGMKTPGERETIQGSATDYISGPISETKPIANAANSAGYADNWQPQTKSCMKPPDDGLFGGGTFAIVGAVVVGTALAIFCTVCYVVAASVAGGSIGVTTATVAVGATGAAAGYMGGSMIDCDDKTLACN